MTFLFDLIYTLGYFFIMILFMGCAIALRRSNIAWIFYFIGAALQLMAILGNQREAYVLTGGIIVSWMIYFLLLMVTAINIMYVKDKNNKEDCSNYAKSDDISKSKMVGKDIDKTLDMKKECLVATSLNNRKIREDEIEIIRPNVIKKENSLSVSTDLNNNEQLIEEDKSIESNEEIVFCRKCGTQLMYDSEFCHKCGCKKVH